MAEKGKNFHTFALQSSLFKGHSDWYFCFLKSERIAHVLTILSEHADRDRGPEFDLLLGHAYELPSSIAHLAARDLELEEVLADIFTILTSVRLLTTSNTITKESARILVEELEALAEKLDASTRLSPFVSSDDFLIPPMTDKVEAPLPVVSRELAKKALSGPEILKDISKGHTPPPSKDQQNRLAQVLAIVRENKGVSIKDIAAVVKNCSEKTIQRELNELIRQGLVRRVGERRWSQYEPILGA